MNFKYELDRHLEHQGKTLDDIAYANVFYRDFLGETTILLYKKPNEELSKYEDFEYSNGFGSQTVFGYVVFTDGSWLERGEYDGSEWWEYKRTPSWEEVV